MPRENVPLEQTQRGMVTPVRHGLAQSRDRTREHKKPQIEIKRFSGPEQGFHDPFAKEARAACEKNTGFAQLLAIVTGVLAYIPQFLLRYAVAYPVHSLSPNVRCMRQYFSGISTCSRRNRDFAAARQAMRNGERRCP